VAAPGESNAPATEDPNASDSPDGSAPAPFQWAELKTPLLIGGVVLALAIGGTFAVKKFKRR